MRRRLSPVVIALAAIVVVLLVVATLLLRDTSRDDESARPAPVPSDTVVDKRAKNEAVKRGCSLQPRLLARIWRGFDPKHSPDITIVPKQPNYWGTFTRVSHTGPWDYLQEIPLIFYGPERIVASGEPVREHANITDVFGTVGELVDVDLPARSSRVLDEAIVDDAAGAPKLVVVVIWDGAGRNMLERWPKRWPFLAKLERKGTSFARATVGSSPSVTPPSHANLGTGAFPRDHKLVTIEYRGTDGEIHDAFEKSSPGQLKLTTFGDEVDQAFNNRSKVGMLAWSVAGTPSEGPEAWTTNHLGMLGHGAAIAGGDRDEEVLIGDTGNITANTKIFKLPRYLENFDGLERHAQKLDRADGQADGKWLGHDILGAHDNPAWVDYQLEILTTMIRKSGYGSNNVPDILLTNFKMTDIAAHTYTIDSREVAQTLEAQDDALRKLTKLLDQKVRDYVLIMSADHGHTRDPAKTRAWPINPEELTSDIDRHFKPVGQSLILGSEPVGLYLNRDVARRLKVTARDVAQFLNEYTIRENSSEEELPAGYRNRGSERVLSAAFASDQLPKVMTCAFGSEKPPAELDA